MENFQHDVDSLRRVFFIDVDAMSEDEIFEYLDRIKAAMKIEYFSPVEKKQIVSMLLDNAEVLSKQLDAGIKEISRLLEEAHEAKRLVSEAVELVNTQE